MVTLTIDDHQISVPKGTLVIRAAELMGSRSRGSATIRCSTRSAPAGSAWWRWRASASRWRRAPSPSPPTWWCARSSPREAADKAQHGVMELLLINHPLDCPVCDKGGECPLQNQAMSNGQADTRVRRRQAHVPQADQPVVQVLLDRERCVLCARCTRFSNQIAGDPFIELLERGALQQVGIADGRAVRLLLLRQHRADLPGRRADRHRLPVPGPPVRPGVLAERRASTARRAARSAPTTAAARCCAGWPATTPRSTRSGTATRAAGRSPTPRRATGSPRRWSATPTAASAPRRGRRPSRSRCAGSRPLARDRRAGRRPGDARGCLRVREVRPDRAGHQRHRLPSRAHSAEEAEFLAAAVAGQADGRHLRRPRVGTRRAARGPRARGGVAHRLPAAAQGLPQARPAR